MLLRNVTDNIAVRPPYYAFDEIQTLEDGSLEACIDVEYKDHQEATLISGSEVGRHLAILGSCAASQLLNNSKKHYFLADRATLKLINFAPKQDYQKGLLKAQAYGEIVNKRSAQAKTFLKFGDKNLYQLDVHYNILRDVVFERLFDDFKTPEVYRISHTDCLSLHENPCFFYNDFNPYSKSPNLYNMCISNNRLTCSLGKIPSSMCIGHFPKFPALPVAILFGTLFNASGYLLQHHFKNTSLNYFVEEAIVSANNLAFVNEVVNISTTLLKTEKSSFIFLGYAETKSGKRVGELKTTFCLT